LITKFLGLRAAEPEFVRVLQGMGSDIMPTYGSTYGVSGILLVRNSVVVETSRNPFKIVTIISYSDFLEFAGVLVL
jgi:hypothetical protein